MNIAIYIVIAVLVGGYVWHCEKGKREHAVFVSNVERLGKEAKAAAELKAAADLKAKEKADAEAKRLHADNTALAQRLRDARARSGVLPPAAPTAKRPDLITFDRAELERAIQFLDAGVWGIAKEGDEARIDLDVAKRWAQETLKP